MQLNANQEQILSNLARGKTGEELRRIQQRFDSQGIDVQIGEYAPTSLGLEATEMAGGVLEGLTFGAYDPGERHPAASDFNIPGTDIELGGGNIVGNLVGGAPSAIAGLGVGGAVARKVLPASKFIKKAGPTTYSTGPSIEAAKKAKRAQRVIQLGVGEVVPGTAAGYVRSDGDPAEALQMGATFLIGGLILETTFSLFSKAMKKMKAGKKLDEAEATAVHEFEAVAEKQGVPSPLHGPTGQTNIDDILGSTKVDDPAPDWDKFFTGKSDLPRTPDASDPNWPVAREAPDDFVESYVSRFQQAVLKNLEPDSGPSVVAEETQRRGFIADILDEELGRYSTEKSVFARRLQSEMTDLSNSAADGVKYGVLTPADATNLIRRGFSTTDEQLKKDISAMESKVDVARGTRGNLVDEIRRDIAADAAKAPNPNTSVWPVSKLNDLKEDESIMGFLIREGQEDMGFQSRGPTTSSPRTGEQVLEFRDEAGLPKFVTLQPQDKYRRLGDVAGGGESSIDIARKSPASKEVMSILGDARSRLDRLINDGTSGVTDIPSYHKNMTMDEALQQTTYFREKIRSLEVRMMHKSFNDGHGRIRDKTGEGSWSNSPNAWRKFSLPWAIRKITPPTSSFNLGGHPETARVVALGVFHKEGMGADFGRYMTEYDQIMERFKVGYMEQIRARVGDNAARDTVEKMQQARVRLARALDGDTEGLENAKELIPTYLQLRNLIDDMGNYAEIGLGPGKPLKDYFPHIFDDTVGSWRAKRFFEETGRSNKTLSDIADLDPDDIAGKAQFFADKDRFGVDGYGLDLDNAMYTYIRGMTEKKHMGAFWEAANGRLIALQADPAMAGLASEFKDFVDYALGAPTNSRKRIAGFFRDHDRFQQGMNWMVARVGGAADADLLNKAKALRQAGVSASHEDIQQATQFIEKLVSDSNKFTREGKFSGVANTKRWRAELALKIDDIRQGMSDPNLAPPIISNLYELIVVNKLALSASHGIMNTTQTITNVIPHLGVRAVAKGIKRLFGPDDFEFKSGMTVRDVIEQSGVEQDIPEALEFFGGVRGTMKKVRDDFLMAPATASEKFNRKTALLASYEQLIDKGATHSDALVRSIELVQKAHFPFNRFGTVPAMRNPGIRLLTMFQSYALHQMNFTAETVRDAFGPNGDMAPLIKHMMAYTGLAAAGGVLSGTSFGDKASHPVSDLMEGGINLNTIGGPPSAAILDVLHGNMKQAMNTVAKPTIISRMQKAHASEGIFEGALNLSGFSR